MGLTPRQRALLYTQEERSLLYTPEELSELIDTPEDRAYKKYCEAIGGDPEPLGLQVPDGYPRGVLEMGGVVAVYETCIEQGCTWEELLDYHDPTEDNPDTDL